MNSRTRAIVISISTPVVAFALVGGLLGKVMAREETFQHLKPFDDVVNFIMGNYVEEVSINKVMHGAMRGLTDGLDSESAYLTADQVKEVESQKPLPAGDVGLELTRQYYLRVISARDGSPAAPAGLPGGDYGRAVHDKPTPRVRGSGRLPALPGRPGPHGTPAVHPR